MDLCLQEAGGTGKCNWSVAFTLFYSLLHILSTRSKRLIDNSFWSADNDNDERIFTMYWNVTQPGYPGEEDGEELYESIYEVIRQPSSESDFEEINEEEVCLFVCLYSLVGTAVQFVWQKAQRKIQISLDAVPRHSPCKKRFWVIHYVDYKVLDIQHTF